MTSEEKLQAIFANKTEEAGLRIYSDYIVASCWPSWDKGLLAQKFDNLKSAVDWLYEKTVGRES